MTIDNEFLKAGTAERLTMAQNDANSDDLSRMLGAQAYAELRKIADERKIDDGHLAGKGPANMIFVPGIMGTLLMNSKLSGIWWIDVRTRDYIDSLGLSADGTTDVDGSDNVVPATADTTYTPFLSAALAEPGISHVIFPYDWRKSLLQGTERFRDLVIELHKKNNENPIHIVAHSMGGLAVRAALMQHGEELWPKIGKIVFIGTPHYGATAIAGYLKNHLWGFELMALLGNYLSRATLRSLWGVINLLPAPRGVYPGTRLPDPSPWPSVPGDPYDHPCVNFDLYKADSWKLDLDAGASAKLQTILNATADFHQRMYQAHRALSQERRNKMVVIAGVGYETLFRLAYAQKFFGLWEHADKTFSRVLDNPHRDGDGRVPLASAMLENISKPIRYVYGVHGGLTNIPAVYQDVFRCLKDESNDPMQLPDTVAGALSGHLGPKTESEAPNLDGSASARTIPHDPGLWDLSDPSPERIAAMEKMLEDDALPGFARLHLL